MAYRVGYQGEPGAFSEIAVQKMISHADLIPFRSFPELFEAASIGIIDYAVIAIENALAGSVRENYDLLLAYRDSISILKETEIPIVHNLIALPGVSFPEIRKVYSHPMALPQCQDFLRKHRRQMEAVVMYDTAGSVKMIVEDKLASVAAIASARCADIYGASILCENIGDSPENYTRFFLIGRKEGENATLLQKVGNKTSIVFTTKNEPGTLAECLNLFARFKVNLTKIESRPILGRPWEYFFHLDFLGNPKDPAITIVIDFLRGLTESLHILGCYPTHTRY